ncbi:MAG: glycosyltransferase [Puniceicoccaceae bacterium]|nr:MAG: glycosyltransferase [Puniceicoccaceae bacterium]
MNPDRPPDVWLVIPAFRETTRLPAFLNPLRLSLAEASFSTVVQVVDDGSPPQDQAALIRAVLPSEDRNCRIQAPILLPSNTRKGGAILAGWHRGSARWMAFVDADGAVPPGEVCRVLADAVSGPEDRALLAVRERLAGPPVRRDRLRRIGSRWFSYWAGRIAGCRIRDSQCGFKIIPGPVWKHLEPLLEGSGFCFDVELLARLHQMDCPVREVPIEWSEQSGGHVGLLRHGPGMLWELWRLRERLKLQPSGRQEG